MSRAHGEKGQSLLQLMIVVAILGILGILVAKLTGRVTMSWLTDRLYARMNYSAESVRRYLGSQMRDASIATVSISRQSVGEPLLSKISWVDFSGSSRTVYQVGSKLFEADWSVTNTNVARVGTLLSESLERFHAYYPNLKDPSKIAFVVVLKKNVVPSAGTPAQLSINCEIELKNP